MLLMEELNKQLVREAVDEIWNRANYEQVSRFADENIAVHESPVAGTIRGTESLIQYYRMLRDAFPDVRFTIEDQVAEGDMVVTRWQATATHTGSFQGMPPTGKSAVMSGIDIDRFANGKVVECWPIVDELGLLRQLGLLPSQGDPVVSSEVSMETSTWN
jgi:steroid delta-isomerase-like uncharacterized protein